MMRDHENRQMWVGVLVAIAGIVGVSSVKLTDASEPKIWASPVKLPLKKPTPKVRRTSPVRATDAAQALPRSEGPAFGSSNLNSAGTPQKAVEAVIRF